MGSEGWPEVRLGDLLDVKHGFAFQGQFFREEPTGDVLLTPGNFAIGGGFKGDKFKYYNGPIPRDFVLSAGDLLVTMTDLSKEAGTLGYPALVPESTRLRYLHNQRLGKVLIRDGAPLAPAYLYYVLCTPAYRHEVLAGATGTTVKHTSPSRIAAFRFRLPPTAEQARIAAILSAFDEKIELNRRMNRTLESIARAIFRSWFVDLGPRHGTAERKSAELWPKVPFSETVRVLSGGTPRTSEPDFWGGGLPWYSVADAPSDGDVFVTNTEKTISSAGVENSAARLVQDLTTIVSARGTVGKCALTGREMAFNQSCYGLRPLDSVGYYFTYFSTRNLVEELRRSAHGSVFSTITRDTLRSVCVHRPPSDLVAAFEREVGPLMQRILVAVEQSRALTSTRDDLLPRLVSGDLAAAGATGLSPVGRQ